MWSLIFKQDEEEYDAIPSVWLKTQDIAFYPDKRQSTINKLAKECTSPEEDWLELPIKLIKRDYSSFERCMGDALRKQGGKSTFTTSEEESRGRGQRNKRKPINVDGENSSDNSTEENGKRRKRNLPFPVLNRNRHNIGNRSSNEINAMPERIQCKIKKRHVCTYKKGDTLNLEQIADALCSTSRSLLSMKTILQDGLADLRSSLLKAEISRRDIERQHEEETEEGDPYVEDVLKHFPLKSMLSFEDFNIKLEDAEFKKKALSAISSIGHTSGPSRFITTTLRVIIGEEVVPHFSWRGQKRGGAGKRAFFKTNICSILISAALKIFKTAERKKVETTISGWLAQTQLRIKQGIREHNGHQEDAQIQISSPQNDGVLG